VNAGAERDTSLIRLLFGDGTPRKALITALVVGTVLTLINHGDLILAGERPSLVKMVLTYCVPFCVTTWGAVTGKLAQIRKSTLTDQMANAKGTL